MCVERLLSHGPADQVHVAGNLDRVPIHRLASGLASEEILCLLANYGSDINAPDLHGQPPLILAIQFGKLAIAEQLMEMGAKVNIRDQWGCNALSYAVQRNRHSVIRKLIQRGADHTIQLDEHGTFLHLAATYADLDTVRILIDAKLATRDINQTRKDGLTALDVAKRRARVGHQWREAFRAFLISVTEIRVFGPEEAWGDSDDDVFEEAVEHQG